MSELLKEEKREQINKEKIIWLLTELNHTTENEVLKRYLFYNATESDDDIVEINNRLQAEIVNYIVYRNYGFNMESHSFPNLDNEVIRNMKITDKKEMLQNARKHADEVIQLINSQIYQLNKKEKSQTEGSVTETENPVKDDKQENITAKDISENPVRENIPSENGTSRNKIEDFGKKIGGARKDLWKDRGLDITDIQNMNAAEAAKYITKDNIWKKPDYMKLIQEGMPVHAAFFMKEVRNALPAKVVYSRNDVTPEQIRKRQEDYIHLIQDVKEMLFEVKTDPDINSFFFEFTRK